MSNDDPTPAANPEWIRFDKGKAAKDPWLNPKLIEQPDPKPTAPLYATVIGWAVALGIVCCVVLGVIWLTRVVL